MPSSLTPPRAVRRHAPGARSLELALPRAVPGPAASPTPLASRGVTVLGAVSRASWQTTSRSASVEPPAPPSAAATAAAMPRSPRAARSSSAWRAEASSSTPSARTTRRASSSAGRRGSGRTLRGTRRRTGSAPRGFLASARATISSTHGGRSARNSADRRRRIVHLRLRHGERRVALERQLAARQPVEHDAHRVEIGARVDLVAHHLLGRHVGRRAHHEPGVGQVFGARRRARCRSP